MNEEIEGTYNNVASALLDLMEKENIENFTIKVFSTDVEDGKDLQITCEYIGNKSVVDTLKEKDKRIAELEGSLIDIYMNELRFKL